MDQLPFRANPLPFCYMYGIPVYKRLPTDIAERDKSSCFLAIETAYQGLLIRFVTIRTS